MRFLPARRSASVTKLRADLRASWSGNRLPTILAGVICRRMDGLPAIIRAMQLKDRIVHDPVKSWKTVPGKTAIEIPRPYGFIMIVTTLEATFWEDGVHDAVDMQAPKWEDVETAIRAMDGHVYDSVFLHGAGGSYMGIACGGRQKYVIAGSLAGKGPFILSLGESIKGQCTVTIGGQDNDYLNDEVVPLKVALVVAKTFFERGECDEAFVWKIRPAKM